MAAAVLIMSPTHANKRGVRYRYYVSHAILQNRKAEAGSIARVPAPEIETLVCDSVRRHLAAMDAAEPQTALADRELVQRHVARVIVKPQALDVWLIPTCEASAQAEDHGLQDPAPHRPLTTTITLAWTAPSFAAVKRIIAPRDCRSGQQKASWIGGAWSSSGLPGSSSKCIDQALDSGM